MKIACAHTALHKRAKAILAQHGDALQDTSRSDDLVFLNAMVNKHMVWGTERQQKRLDEIEAQFPISDIVKAQLDPDVAGCVVSNRKRLPTAG